MPSAWLIPSLILSFSLIENPSNPLRSLLEEPFTNCGKRLSYDKYGISCPFNIRLASLKGKDDQRQKSYLSLKITDERGLLKKASSTLLSSFSFIAQQCFVTGCLLNSSLLDSSFLGIEIYEGASSYFCDESKVLSSCSLLKDSKRS